jgi:alpha-glucosidase (family GH31 glycosyl hydrolase)
MKAWRVWDVLLLCAVWPVTALGQLVVGNARFTVITPQCIRMEYSASGKFVDEPSYFATARDARSKDAQVSSDGGRTVIDTGETTLTYKPDGKEFSADNLQATIKKGTGTVEWKPGLTNKSNLGGTERTLDGWDGAGKLSDGVLSRDGWYLIDDSKTVLFTSDWVKARPADAGSDWYLFGYGTDFKAALKSLMTISGPVPMPRRYTLGAWYSRYWPYSSADYRQIIQEYADHGFPLDVLVMDMDWHKDGWTGYTWNPKLLSDHAEFLKWVHQQGLAVTLNDHPATGVGKQEDCYADFMREMGKDPANDKPLAFDAGDKKYLDTFYQYTHKPFEKEGVDFWWLDWQQFPATRSIASLTNLAWLNHYNYQDTSGDGRRGASFSRWAGWGSQRYPIQFSGDASTAFRMLAFEVPFTSTAGNVGCFFWSHDIGGHNRGRNEESYARWCQFGAFSAALRSHSTRDATMDRRPWTYAKWAEDSMKTSFQLRSRFFPCIYSAVQQACADSVPFVRPMYLDQPDVEAAYHQPQQYLFGDNILVAPVAEAGVGPNHLGRQTVWFPGGTWFNCFSNEKFEGEQQVLVAADINEFPLYIRGGVPIAMRAFTQRMATDPLSELVIRCYPGGENQPGTSTLYEDDGLTTAYKTGAFAQTKLSYIRRGPEVTLTISPAQGTFDGQVKRRSYVVELPATKQATKALIDGEPATVEYVEAESINRVKIPARSIQKGCAVLVSADEADSAIFKTCAFARRAGLKAPAANASIADLLGNALDRAQEDGVKAATLAAAGVGVFSRNENVYGYPARGTDTAFSPADLHAQVHETPPPVDDLAAVQLSSFSVNVAGHTLSVNGTPAPIDWRSKPGNIASAAHITVSSGGPVKGLVDGNINGYPGPREAEWTTKAEKAGAWARLEWTSPQTIDHVVLFDRPNENDQVTAGKIEFSDGSVVAFGALENDASRGTEVKFDPKTVSWLKITITAVGPKTENTGLAEVAVFKALGK